MFSSESVSVQTGTHFWQEQWWLCNNKDISHLRHEEAESWVRAWGEARPMRSNAGGEARRLRGQATGTAWLPPTPRGGGTAWPGPPHACGHVAPLTTISISLSFFVMNTSIKSLPNSQSLPELECHRIWGAAGPIKVNLTTASKEKPLSSLWIGCFSPKLVRLDCFWDKEMTSPRGQQGSWFRCRLSHLF